MTNRPFAFRFCAFISTGILIVLTALSSGCSRFDPASLTDADVEKLAEPFLGDGENFVELIEPCADREKIIATVNDEARRRGLPQKTKDESDDDGETEKSSSANRFLEDAIPKCEVVFGGVRRTDGTVGAIFRLERAELGGATYVVGICGPGPRGAAAIVDFEFPEFGRTLDDAIVNSVLEIAPLPGEDKPSRFVALVALTMLNENYSTNEVVAFYEQQKFAQLQIFAADQIYLNALETQWRDATQPTAIEKLTQKIAETSERIKAYNPKSVAGDLALINGGFRGVSQEKALETLANVRRIVGDDAYFDFVESELYAESDPEKAAELSREAERKGWRALDD